MPHNTVISVQGLGKRYRIGEFDSYRSLREVIPKMGRRLLGRGATGDSAASSSTDFWALRDISFDVQDGDVVGIIGHNGAGKSTLLKLLSRITEPTEGRARICGRVSSLLEVGTGFHPELTGRENVYLNGAILGMTRHEIKRKFDEIVEFSGVEKFLDTPVKRYSSGMSVRLAFAVAAHLEPEVLIIDEVLAVGDAEFQNKCLGKMESVARTGRTVLFVSHNMAAVEALCTRAMLLSRGGMLAQGDVGEVINAYLSRSTMCAADMDLSEHPGRATGCQPVFRRIRILDEHGDIAPSVRVGGDATFEFTLVSRQLLSGARLFVDVEGPRGERLFRLSSYHQHSSSLNIDGAVVLRACFRNCRLCPGRYLFRPRLKCQGKVIDTIQEGLYFEVSPADIYGTGRSPDTSGGPFLPEATWDFSGSLEPTAAASADLATQS